MRASEGALLYCLLPIAYFLFCLLRGMHFLTPDP